MEILTVINSLRESDKYIKTIFLEGGCYQFHLFLKALFPECMAMINEERDHVITHYQGKYYDITGEVKNVSVGYDFNYLTLSNISLVESWSFSGNKILSLGECQYCEEPILI